MPSWLLPIIVGWVGGTVTAGLGAYASHRWALTRDHKAHRHAVLRERYDKGQRAIQLWIDSTEDLNMFQSRVEHNDVNQEYWAIAEVFGRQFAGDAISFLDKEQSFAAQEACLDAMIEHQEHLEQELGLPPVVDLHEEQVRHFKAQLQEREQRDRLLAAKKAAKQKENPAPAATDAGRDNGDVTSDDEEDDRDG